jgi:uncharacterized peroxidase-related enzyme
MPRVKPLTIDEVAPEAREDFAHYAAMFTEFENQVPVYAHSPAGLKHIFGMTTAIRAAGNLPQRLVELAVVAVSQVNACPYCVAHHSAMAVDEGIDPETIDHILDPEPPGLDEVEILVRDYAVLVTERAWGIRDKIFEDLREHFTEEQIVELTMRITLTGMFNRINQALQIDMEDGVMPAFEARGLDASALPEPEAN